MKAAALSAVLLVAGVACTAPPVPESPPPSAPARTGGTLRIGVVGDAPRLRDLVYADMGKLTVGMFARCCMARSLFTYPGETTVNGGTVLLPDLARELPEIAPDGLTWTIRLREGLTYAPPHDDLPITARDVVVAVERSIRLNGDVFPPFAMVAGTREFVDGSASTVSGMQTPDEHTLVIRLRYPSGALAFLADPSWAPVPAALVEDHDDDLGYFWPSSGPYMLETYPGDPEATSVALVRNPAWSSAVDPHRPAHPDRIEVSLAGDTLEAALAVLERGEVDLLTERLDLAAAARLRSDPGVIPRLRSTPSEYLYRLPMNIAVPPFDDVALRRAVAFAIDRLGLSEAVVEALGQFAPQTPVVLSQHAFGDAVTGGLLTAYDPFALGDGHGNITRARTEMRASSYDTDGDGRCDALECRGVEMPVFDMEAGEVVARSLESIGIEVLPVQLVEGPGGNDMQFPSNRTAMAVLPYGWGFDLSGTELSVLIRGGAEMMVEPGFTVNTSLVGARSSDLQGWGYEVTAVPSVDDVIERCEGEYVGSRRARCWAELDQYVSERIVPWVPLFARESVWVASSRVQEFSLDQATPFQFPAFDAVQLAPGSE